MLRMRIAAIGSLAILITSLTAPAAFAANNPKLVTGTVGTASQAATVGSAATTTVGLTINDVKGLSGETWGGVTTTTTDQTKWALLSLTVPAGSALTLAKNDGVSATSVFSQTGMTAGLGAQLRTSDGRLYGAPSVNFANNTPVTLGTVTIVPDVAGTYTLDVITYTGAAGGPFTAVTATATFTATAPKTAQTVSFTSSAPGSAVVAGSTYTPTATATSGLTAAITVDASASSVCSISAGAVSFQSAGTCVLNANQAGDGTYAAAPQVQQSFSVGKGSQTVSFTSSAPGAAVVAGSTYTPTATATSGLTAAITVDASASSVCSISAGAVSFQSAGTCVLNANQAGNANYNAASQVQQSFSVGQGSQTVSFTSSAPGAAVVSGSTYTPTATATSGLTVAITVDASASSVCSISGGIVSFQAVGSCVLNANQAGSANYNAASQVQQSFSVGKGSQTVSYTSSAPGSATVGGTTYTPTATATSGLAVAISVDGTASAICSISGGVVSFLAVGNCKLNANQAGNTNYNAASQVQQTFAVAKGSQTISFTSSAPLTAAAGGASYTPTATATSGLSVTITVDGTSTGCSISGGVVSFTGLGTCKLNANQAGNANYNAASQVQQTFSVKAANTVSFTSSAPGSAAVGGSTYTPTATATSGLTVTITVDATAALVCSITGGVVSFTDVGNCVLNADQAGDGTYAAAVTVQQTFAVSIGSQSLSFTSSAPGAATAGGATYTPTATSTAGLTVTITVDGSSSSVCSISGGVVTFLAAGTCKLNANQAGFSAYAAATQVQQSFTVAAGQALVTGGLPLSSGPATQPQLFSDPKLNPVFAGIGAVLARFNLTMDRINYSLFRTNKMLLRFQARMASL